MSFSNNIDWALEDYGAIFDGSVDPFHRIRIMDEEIALELLDEEVQKICWMGQAHRVVLLAFQAIIEQEKSKHDVRPLDSKMRLNSDFRKFFEKFFRDKIKPHLGINSHINLSKEDIAEFYKEFDKLQKRHKTFLEKALPADSIIFGTFKSVVSWAASILPDAVSSRADSLFKALSSIFTSEKKGPLIDGGGGGSPLVGGGGSPLVGGGGGPLVGGGGGPFVGGDSGSDKATKVRDFEAKLSELRVEIAGLSVPNGAPELFVHCEAIDRAYVELAQHGVEESILRGLRQDVKNAYESKCAEMVRGLKDVLEREVVGMYDQGLYDFIAAVQYDDVFNACEFYAPRV
jgi:hypothetical protein